MAGLHICRSFHHNRLLGGKNELTGGLLGVFIKGSNTSTFSSTIAQAQTSASAPVLAPHFIKKLYQ